MLSCLTLLVLHRAPNWMQVVGKFQMAKLADEHFGQPLIY